MKQAIQICIMIMLFSTLTDQAFGHFGMLIPSGNMVMQNDKRSVNLQLSFSHPMKMIGMELVKPKVFNLVIGGDKHDLLDELKPTRVMEHSAWHLDYQIKRPRVYMFYMEPHPFWEPAEDVFIIHYTKTVVTAFGNDEGPEGQVFYDRIK